MDPPSTPAPVALRGRLLDHALRDVEPSRAMPGERPERDLAPAPSSTPPRDPRAALVAAERFLSEQQPPSWDGPLTMRGDMLAAALDMARSSRVRLKH